MSSKKAIGAGTGALSGAAAGSAIMPGIGTGIGALIGGLGGFFGSSDDDLEAQYQQQMAQERAQAKAAQYAALGTMQAPSLSDATKARIAALEDQSKATSLAEDPYFQAQRAGLVQGGQQALSNIANTQRAQGTTGGFANQGSIGDAYDRLSAQLSGLGQQSINLKDQKAQQAASMQQQFLDSQNAFANAQARAKMAIEAGDSQGAASAIQEAYKARTQSQNQQNQALGQMFGGVLQGAGSYLGKSRAPATGNTGSLQPDMSQATTLDAANYDQPYPGSEYGQPYSATKRRQSNYFGNVA